MCSCCWSGARCAKNPEFSLLCLLEVDVLQKVGLGKKKIRDPVFPWWLNVQQVWKMLLLFPRGGMALKPYPGATDLWWLSLLLNKQLQFCIRINGFPTLGPSCFEIKGHLICKQSSHLITFLGIFSLQPYKIKFIFLLLSLK